MKWGSKTLSCVYAWTISDIHSLQTDTCSDPTAKFAKLVFMRSVSACTLQVEPAVGAALLAWNAIASELDGDIRTVQ